MAVLCNFQKDVKVCYSRGNETTFFLLYVYLFLQVTELYCLTSYDCGLFLSKYPTVSLEKIKTKTKDLSRGNLCLDQKLNP